MILPCFKCKKEFVNKYIFLRHIVSCREERNDLNISEIIINYIKQINQTKKELNELKIMNDNQKTIIKTLKKENSDYKNLNNKQEKTITSQNKIIYESNSKNIDEHIFKNDIDYILHNTLIEVHDSYSGVYLGFVGENIVKFGKTNGIKKRATHHLKDFLQFKLFYFVQNIDSTTLENNLKNHILLKPHLTIMKVNNELFLLNKDLTI
jgi:hypothetical protein